MYSKEESHQIRTKFWTSFGQYMKLQKSSEGQTTNWVNYKTGIKDLYFRTEVGNKSARIAVEIASKDEGMRDLLYEQFEEFRPLFESYFEQEWEWVKGKYEDSGKTIHSISLQLDGVSLFRESDWPAIISFLKTNLVKWDEFWNDTKDSFEIFK